MQHPDSTKHHSKSTITVAKTLRPPFSSEFQVIITVPAQKPDVQKSGEFNAHTIPITVHLSKEGSASTLGAYIYSIVDTRDQNMSVYQTILNNSTEIQVDLAKKLGTLLSKKYASPSYVSISGDIALEDFLPVTRELFGFIDEQYASI